VSTSDVPVSGLQPAWSPDVEESEDVLQLAIAQEMLHAPPAMRGWRGIAMRILLNRSLAITLVGVVVFVFYASS
jgi:hypothetical protein